MGENNGVMKKVVSLINMTLFPLGIVASLFLARYLLVKDFRTCGCKTSQYLQSYYPQELNFESKTDLFFSVFGHLGVLFFTMTSMVMGCRIVTQANPLKKEEEPLLIKGINRAIQNTLEQSFVFLGIFGFWLFKLSKPEDIQLSVAFALIFFASRALYLLGYLIQVFTGIIVLRSSAFALTLTTNVLLVSIIIGHSLINHFSETFDYKKYL